MLQRVRDKMVKSKECRCISEIGQFPLDANGCFCLVFGKRTRTNTGNGSFFLEQINAFLFVNQIQSRCAIDERPMLYFVSEVCVQGQHKQFVFFAIVPSFDFPNENKFNDFFTLKNGELFDG